MFITFCDSGSQGRCSIKKKKSDTDPSQERSGGDLQKIGKVYKHGAVIGGFAPRVCSGGVIYFSQMEA